MPRVIQIRLDRVPWTDVPTSGAELQDRFDARRPKVNQLAVAQSDLRERQAFEHLLEQTLAPLMPIAISYGMNANDLALATRVVYLREMEARLQKERGHTISEARLALVAGLTRREVERVRRGASGKDSSRSESAEQLTRIAVVLSAWHTNPRFSGAYGVPLDLDLNRSEGPANRSIADLIETACAELPQAVTLDELVAQGVVELVGGTLVRCKARAAVSRSKAGSGKEGLLAQYGRFLATATGTVAHNIAAENSSDAYFDRLLTSDGPLSDRTRRLFHARAMASADAFLTELDSWLSKDTDEPTEDSGRLFGVGVFFFEENRGEDSASAEGDASQ